MTQPAQHQNKTVISVFLSLLCTLSCQIELVTVDTFIWDNIINVFIHLDMGFKVYQTTLYHMDSLL